MRSGKPRSMPCLIAMILCAMLMFAGTAAGQSVRYVDDNAPAGGNGLAWATAYTFLQDALTEAAASGGTITEIRVGQGTYKPDQDELNPLGTGDRFSTFELIDGVSWLGGYEGFGAVNPDLRDPATFETILSGDLAGDDLPNFESIVDNSYHVLTSGAVGSGTVLDGLIIERGAATEVTLTERWGGGLINDGGDALISNCHFRMNFANRTGGAVYNLSGSDGTFEDCVFEGNKAHDAGAVFNLENAASFNRCIFRSNTNGTGSGAAVANSDSLARFVECDFLDNKTDTHGGAVKNSSGAPEFVDCVFAFNFAGEEGGAVLNALTNAKFDQCLFDRNIALLSGGAMHNRTSSNIVVSRCVFRVNRTLGEGGGMYEFNESTSTVINTVFMRNEALNGGAMFIRNSRPRVTNCLFNTNIADENGGGVYGTATLPLGNPEFVNCTFTGNFALGLGGGLYKSPKLKNCILWLNSDSAGSGQSSQIVPDPTTSVTHSCIQGLDGSLGGIGNIGLDPEFVDRDGADDLVGTDDDDMSLMPGSPVIDAGDNSKLPADETDLDDDLDTSETIPLDLAFTPRKQDDPAVADTGLGTAPIVEMGAYEFVGSSCPADIDGSGVVNVSDLLELLAAWGVCPTGCASDIDESGTVNVSDLLVLLAQWGVCP